MSLFVYPVFPGNQLLVVASLLLIIFAVDIFDDIDNKVIPLTFVDVDMDPATCLICDKGGEKTYTARRNRRKSTNFEKVSPVSSSVAQVLCKALKLPQGTFLQRIEGKGLCPSCKHRVEDVDWVVVEMEKLKRILDQFKFDVLTSLEQEQDEQYPLPAEAEGSDPDETASRVKEQKDLRSDIVAFFVGWRERFISCKVKLEGDRGDEMRMRGTPSSDKSSKRKRLDHENLQAAKIEDGEEDYIVGLPVPNDDTVDIDSPDRSDEEIRYRRKPPPRKKKRKRGITQVDGHKCSKCKDNFKTALELKMHVKKRHEGEKQPFICALTSCSRSFRLQSLLDKHMLIHKTKEDPLRRGRHTCDLCEKVYETKNSLERHRSSHTGVWKFPCPSCEKGFHRPSSLNHHIAVVHKSEKPFECPHCEERFVSSRRRIFHLSSIHPEKTQEEDSTQCSICFKTFAARDVLRCHTLQVHGSDEKLPFSCSECGKGFIKKSWLDRHALQHTPDKKFICGDCGERFRFPSSLKTHMLKHKGVLPFSCPLPECGKGFKLKTQLNIHTQTHQLERFNTCEFCGKSFVLSLYLRQHLKRLHYKELGLSERPSYLSKPKRKRSTKSITASSSSNRRTKKKVRKEEHTIAESGTEEQQQVIEEEVVTEGEQLMEIVRLDNHNPTIFHVIVTQNPK